MILLAVLYFVCGVIVGGGLVALVATIICARIAHASLRWVVSFLRRAHFRGIPLDEVTRQLETLRVRLEILSKGADMSAWTHLLCVACWNARNPTKPARTTDDVNDPDDPCCACGTKTGSGIYTRANPEELLCKGRGVVHRDEAS